MKSPTLGLAISTLAFAGSSIYLWNQLAEQRARAEEVTELTHRGHRELAQGCPASRGAGHGPEEVVFAL